MTTHPYIFPQEQIPAILDGRKTQFRVEIEPQPNFPFGIKSIVSVPDVFHNDAFRGTPADGFGTKGKRENKFYCEDYCGNLIAEFNFQFPYKIGDQLRVQSNVKIEITGVRVEHVQDITEEDCLNEFCRGYSDEEVTRYTPPRAHFKEVWNSTHGDDAWDRNDWIWVFEFKRVK